MMNSSAHIFRYHSFHKFSSILMQTISRGTWCHICCRAVISVTLFILCTPMDLRVYSIAGKFKRHNIFGIYLCLLQVLALGYATPRHSVFATHIQSHFKKHKSVISVFLCSLQELALRHRHAASCLLVFCCHALANSTFCVTSATSTWRGWFAFAVYFAISATSTWRDWFAYAVSFAISAISTWRAENDLVCIVSVFLVPISAASTWRAESHHILAYCVSGAIAATSTWRAESLIIHKGDCLDLLPAKSVSGDVLRTLSRRQYLCRVGSYPSHSHSLSEYDTNQHLLIGCLVCVCCMCDGIFGNCMCVFLGYMSLFDLTNHVSKEFQAPSILTSSQGCHLLSGPLHLRTSIVRECGCCDWGHRWKQWLNYSLIIRVQQSWMAQTSMWAQLRPYYFLQMLCTHDVPIYAFPGFNPHDSRIYPFQDGCNQLLLPFSGLSGSVLEPLTLSQYVD